jgi:hypothetical protein
LKGRKEMSKYRIFAFIALITLAFGVALVGNALAGEKVKGRIAAYNVKWEQVQVGDEEGHVLAVVEDKGISFILMGRMLPDGMLYRDVTLLDSNLKTWVGSHVTYSEYTDRDGDKYYSMQKGKLVGKGGWEGEWAYIKGIGKFEGIQGKGTWVGLTLSPTQWYVDWEGEMDLPRR